MGDIQSPANKIKNKGNEAAKSSRLNEKTKTATLSSSQNEKPLFAKVHSRHGTRLKFCTNDTCEMLQNIPTHVVATRLDSVLQAVRQLDNTCDHSNCRTKTSLMHMDCQCCGGRFCFKHGLPEAHGCGEAMRLAEQAAFRQSKPKPRVVKSRQIEERDLRRAQKRLQQKLNEMSTARKAKQS